MAAVGVKGLKHWCSDGCQLDDGITSSSVDRRAISISFQYDCSSTVWDQDNV